jgi:cyclic beta-1,2-glucan synthetase
MYRVGIEAILGITLRGGALHIDPCIPRAWRGYQVVVALPGADRYTIRVENPDGVNRGVSKIELDGTAVSGDVPVLRDGVEHTVTVTLGEQPAG